MKIIRSMRSYLFLIFAFSLVKQLQAQNTAISIGYDTPKDNAVLFLYSPRHDQGLIIPVSDRSKINSPESGMVVFDQNDNQLYFHDGTKWVAVNGGNGSANLKIDVLGNSIRLFSGTALISTSPISASSPATGQLFLWNGSSWTASTLGGDIAISGNTVKVTGLLGKGLPSLPAVTQSLVYNGTSWAFQPLSSVTSVGGTSPINVSNGTTSALVTINQSTGSQDGYLTSADWVAFNNKIGNGSAAGGDLSGTYPNPTVAKLRNNSIATTAPTNGQILKWNQTASWWEPSSDNVGPVIPTLNDGQVLLGNGVSNFAQAINGDATISNTGIVTISNDAITTSKIANAAVTDSKIGSVSSTKVTGITDQHLPRSNGGTSLIDSQIQDDGIGVGIGNSPNSGSKVNILNNATNCNIGLDIDSYPNASVSPSVGATISASAPFISPIGTSTLSVGVFGEANNFAIGVSDPQTGVSSSFISSGVSSSVGVYGKAENNFLNYGIYGEATYSDAVSNIGGSFEAIGGDITNSTFGITCGLHSTVGNVGEMHGVEVSIEKPNSQVGIGYLFRGDYTDTPLANLSDENYNRWGIYIQNEQYNYLSGRLSIGTAYSDWGMGNLQVKQGNNSATDGIWLSNGNSTYSFWVDGASQNLTLRKIGLGMIGSFNKTTGAYTNVSDRRLKKDIEPLPAVISSVMKLKPSSYLFKDQEKTEEKNIGLIAQDVKEIFPSLVKHNAADDLYTLDYSGFGVLAIKAIQEQQKLLEDQNQIIENLKKQLQSVEEKIARYESVLTILIDDKKKEK